MEIKLIKQFREKVENNLFENIIPFWLRHSVDVENGGFYGRISNDLIIDTMAPKSLILISRILWSFSALYQFRPAQQYLDLASRAYDYLQDKFLDKEHGGYYWLVDHKGKAIEDMKKIYGQAFVIYSFCEYYTASGDKSALDNAIVVFELIEKYNHDDEFKGYFEASHRNWSIAENMRLSEVDMAEKKSMNTHLHMMEAYTNLFRFWKDERICVRLRELIQCHLNHIIDPDTNHLRMFFDERWNPKSSVVSFGHDIETSWLLCEAANVLGDDGLIARVRELALKMVTVTAREGISEPGAIYAEKNGNGETSANGFDWWPQAEAVVGFLNAFQYSGRESDLAMAMRLWDFIENNLVDTEFGEWFYAVTSAGLPNPGRSKVCEWKGPYHNSRSCIEILNRLSALK